MTANTENEEKVVDLNAYRTRRRTMTPGHDKVEQFITEHAQADLEVLTILSAIHRQLFDLQIDPNTMSESDITLLREAIYSVLMSTRGQHHPLQHFAKDFHKYFRVIDEYLDS